MGRHPKIGACDINIAIKVPKSVYSKLRMIAIEKDTSHIKIIEQMIMDYLQAQSVSGQTQ